MSFDKNAVLQTNTETVLNTRDEFSLSFRVSHHVRAKKMRLYKNSIYLNFGQVNIINTSGKNLTNQSNGLVESVTQSSTYNGYDADNAINGIWSHTVGDFSHTNNTLNPEWWQVTFTSEHDIAYYEIYNRMHSAFDDDRINGVTVELYDASNKRSLQQSNIWI